MTHIYTLAGGERRRIRHFLLNNINVHAVLHDHLESEPCDGNCPQYNAPDEDADTGDRL